MSQVPTMTTGTRKLSMRFELKPGDVEAVRQITESTGFFSSEEVGVAIELAEDRVQKGAASDYHFIMGDLDGRPVAYTNFGRIACTVSSFDLYWLAVDKQHQGSGWGRKLLTEAENRIRALGGTRVYVETSNRAQYAPTRAFYERCDYRIEAILPDFYAPGDDKVVYIKILD
jgi:ribosomal protein S18 acetylase RimI-like enzyme